MSSRWRIGIDIGGTFTDFVALDTATGRLVTAKELTTPANPALAVLTGIGKLQASGGVRLADTVDIVHGTTLATNAIVERKGARTALITTQGFRDVLEIGRERRYDIYDLMFRMPAPLVPRELRWEVRERIDVDGVVVEPLDEGAIGALAQRIVDEGIESLAIALLCSFRNGEHERRLRESIQARCPALPISISVDVDPQVREYDRTSTTVVNAYVQPIVKRYLLSLGDDLRKMGYGGELHIMLSSGGVISSRTASEFPSRIIESGPAGGVAAASYYSRLCGIPNVIAFDMGGTTAKICLIEDGLPTKVTETEVGRVQWHKHGSGFPLRVPMIEMIEIGTGGGSVARVNALGLLDVGPESAGAAPGPACYGLGGTRPTVTDANLILGYLDAGYFLGGEMALDRALAERAIRHDVGVPLGMSLEAAAFGIHEIATESMANAARLHAVSKGRDPAAYALLASGGAAASHAHRLAAKLGISRVICPASAGVLSSLGFLLAPVSYEIAQGRRSRLAEVPWASIRSMYAEMRTQVAQFLQDASVAAASMRFELSALMSYEGQGYEVEVPVPRAAIDDGDLDAIRAVFEARYRSLYGALNTGFDAQVLSWKLRGSGPLPDVRIDAAHVGALQRPRAKGMRQVYAGTGERYEPWPVYDRYALAPDTQLTGPAVIEERESTVVVPAGARVRIDEHLSLIVDLRVDALAAPVRNEVAHA